MICLYNESERAYFLIKRLVRLKIFAYFPRKTIHSCQTIVRGSCFASHFSLILLVSAHLLGIILVVNTVCA